MVNSYPHDINYHHLDSRSDGGSENYYPFVSRIVFSLRTGFADLLMQTAKRVLRLYRLCVSSCVKLCRPVGRHISGKNPRTLLIYALEDGESEYPPGECLDGIQARQEQEDFGNISRSCRMRGDIVPLLCSEDGHDKVVLPQGTIDWNFGGIIMIQPHFSSIT